MKKTILFIFVILWMIIIFLFSNMNSTSSNGSSTKIINDTIEQTVEIAESTSIIDEKPSEKEINNLVDDLNTPLRKCAHSTVYFILAILLILAIKEINKDKRKVVIFTFIISFIYACTDEIHQLFISGRTGHLTDVLIDMIGVILACLIYIFITYKKREMNYEKNK